MVCAVKPITRLLVKEPEIALMQESTAQPIEFLGAEEGVSTRLHQRHEVRFSPTSISRTYLIRRSIDSGANVGQGKREGGRCVPSLSVQRSVEIIKQVAHLTLIRGLRDRRHPALPIFHRSGKTAILGGCLHPRNFLRVGWEARVPGSIYP